MQQGNSDQAIVHWRAVLNLDPTDQTSAVRTRQSLRRRESPVRRRRSIRSARAPRFLRTMPTKTHAALLTRRWAKTKRPSRHSNRLLHQIRKMRLRGNNLGVTLEKVGSRKEAIAAYQHALKANPDLAEAKSNLARFNLPTTPVSNSQTACTGELDAMIPLRKVGLIANADKPAALQYAAVAVKYLEGRVHSVLLQAHIAKHLGRPDLAATDDQVSKTDPRACLRRRWNRAACDAFCAPRTRLRCSGSILVDSAF